MNLRAKIINIKTYLNRIIMQKNKMAIAAILLTVTAMLVPSRATGKGKKVVRRGAHGSAPTSPGCQVFCGAFVETCHGASLHHCPNGNYAGKGREGGANLSVLLPFFHAFRLQKEIKQTYSKDAVVVAIGSYVILDEDDFLE